MMTEEQTGEVLDLILRVGVHVADGIPMDHAVHIERFVQMGVAQGVDEEKIRAYEVARIRKALGLDP